MYGSMVLQTPSRFDNYHTDTDFLSLYYSLYKQYAGKCRPHFEGKVWPSFIFIPSYDTRLSMTEKSKKRT